MDRGHILEGLAIVFGAVLAGFGAKFLPSFQYSSLVYGIAGVFIIVLALGWMSHQLVRGVAIGFGAGLGTQIVPGITGLVASGSGKSS